jgi:hypothetical protein
MVSTSVKTLIAQLNNKIFTFYGSGRFISVFKIYLTESCQMSIGARHILRQFRKRMNVTFKLTPSSPKWLDSRGALCLFIFLFERPIKLIFFDLINLITFREE